MASLPRQPDEEDEQPPRLRNEASARYTDTPPLGELPEAGVGGEGLPYDLSVLAPRTDREIADGVRTALELDPDVNAQHLSVEVQDGIVTLTGHVQSLDEVQRAVADARRVANVQDIVNHIEQ